MEAVAAQYNCTAAQETYTCNTQRFVREGHNIALNASRPEDPDPEEFVVQDSEVYHINMVMSTGNGRIHEAPVKPTSTFRFVRATEEGGKLCACDITDLFAMLCCSSALFLFGIFSPLLCDLLCLCSARSFFSLLSPLFSWVHAPVFQRNVERVYNLKLKTSRAIYSEISERFPTMPFPLRALDPKTGPYGVKECLTHQLLDEYPVMSERAGEKVAQVQFTVLVTDAKTVQLNGLAPPFVQSLHSIVDPQLQSILALPAKTGVSSLTPPN